MKRYVRCPNGARRVLGGWLAVAVTAALLGPAQAASPADHRAPSPYPPSALVRSLSWHWDTYTNAAPGSDLWPVTWGPDDRLYVAWGDGGGFGGTDSNGRVALGFGCIEGSPEHWRGVNLNGGQDPEHPASFARKGKTSGIAFVDGVLYSTINLQDGTWPNVNHVLAWSADKGATWTRADWLFTRGPGRFHPAKFLQFGKDYEGAPSGLEGYVYLYGPREEPGTTSGGRIFLVRVPKTQLRDQRAYQFFTGLDGTGSATWSAESALAQAVFVDPNGVTPAAVVYDPGIKRFLLTSFHVGPSQLGVFEGPTPWGPWGTIAYQEDWGQMRPDGEGLSCEFPQRWMSADGLTLWAVFSVYGSGAKQGIGAHDRLNLIQASLTLR